MPACPNGHELADPTARYCLVCGEAILSARSLPLEATCALHPDRPTPRTCPRCGTFACDECLAPDEAGRELCFRCRALEPSTLLPWDRRRELGLLRAYWDTARLVLFQPGPTFQQARPQGEIGEGLLFLMISGVMGTLPTLLFEGVGLVGLFNSGGGKAAFPFPDMPIGASWPWLLLGVAVLLLVSPVLLALILSSVEHLALRLIGAHPRDWKVTFRGYSLATAPQVLGLLPVCGSFLAVVWIIVARAFAYRGLHRVTGGQATAAVLAAPVLVACGWCGLAISLALLIPHGFK